MKKHNGSVLIELLCVVGLMGIFLNFVILQMGNSEDRLQRLQVNLAARRLIMDARGVQEYNMFDKEKSGYYIKVTNETDYYLVYPQKDNVLTQDMFRYFADLGCAGVYLAVADGSPTEYKPTSSVNDEKQFTLRHRKGTANEIINLQPVTGRIEIAQK